MAPIVMNLNEWQKQLKLVNYNKMDLILDYLTNGVELGNSGPPRTNFRVCPNLPTAMGKEFEDKISEEMEEECRLGRRAGPFDAIPLPNLQCSPIGSVPKKNSSNGIRVIHHLSYPRNESYASINSLINNIECKLVKFSEVLMEVYKKGKNCLMAKYDIKSAFRLIRVRIQDQHLLGMSFKGKFYYELCLPFGLKSAPGLFELFATAIEAFLHNSGIKIVRHYIDDYITISVASQPLAQLDYDKVIKMFKKLKINLSVEKLQKPATRIEFLGLIIDSNLMQVELPSDKLIRYRAILLKWRTKIFCTIKELQSLVGKLVFASYAIQHGRSFYRRLLDLLKKSNESDTFSIRIDEHARMDIKWWENFLVAWNGINIIPPSLNNYLKADQHLLFTDACQTGMGAYYNNKEYIRHAWNTDELKKAQRVKTLSMPYLELLSLVHSINVWADRLSGKAVILNCDCEPVVLAVNSGRSFDPAMMKLIRMLIFITTTHKIFINLQHIEGEKNIDADLLSRSTFSNSSSQLKEFMIRNQKKGTKEQIIKDLPIIAW
jgi:hypothetical protein